MVTGAGRLPQRAVIHAVGPVWRGGGAGEAEALASAHRAVVERAEEEGLATIALPAISTGIFGYPVELAAPVAVAAVGWPRSLAGGDARAVLLPGRGGPGGLRRRLSDCVLGGARGAGDAAGPASRSRVSGVNSYS